MKCIRGIALVPMILLCLVGACGDTDNSINPLPVRFPYDFSVRYYYSAGSVAPPHHFSCYIAINHVGYDTISFRLSYPFEYGEQPTRAERFDASVRQLNDLYDLMIDRDIFRDYWEIMEEPPCGGPSRALQVTADENRYAVPAFVVDEASVAPVYSAIGSLVPAALWDTLWAWRDRYIATQP